MLVKLVITFYKFFFFFFFFDPPDCIGLMFLWSLVLSLCYRVPVPGSLCLVLPLILLVDVQAIPVVFPSCFSVYSVLVVKSHANITTLLYLCFVINY